MAKIGEKMVSSRGEGWPLEVRVVEKLCAEEGCSEAAPAAGSYCWKHEEAHMCSKCGCESCAEHPGAPSVAAVKAAKKGGK